MALIAWPPLNAPKWPPPDYSILEFASIDSGLDLITDFGWFWRKPTPQEEQLYFNAARCERGHRVNGIMIVDSRLDGKAYPFARCRGMEHEELVLWHPYSIGHTE